VIALIPLFPFAGFVVNALLGRRLSKTISGGLASLMMVASFAVSLGVVMELRGMEPANRII
jgi:NADH-quinone oxidoreductase subunit L